MMTTKEPPESLSIANQSIVKERKKESEWRFFVGWLVRDTERYLPQLGGTYPDLVLQTAQGTSRRHSLTVIHTSTLLSEIKEANGSRRWSATIFSSVFWAIWTLLFLGGA